MGTPPFVDTQPQPFLRHQGRHLGDAQAAGEQSLLVVVDREVPGLHQVQVGAADQDRLHPALVEGDQLPGAANLTRVAGIEEQQVPGQRHHLQRVLARAGGKQQFSLGAEDVAIQREARVEVEGPHRFGRTQAGDRRRILHGRDAPFPDLRFKAPEFAAAFLRAQALLDHLEQMGFADLVGRPDDAQVHGPCASRAQHQTEHQGSGHDAAFHRAPLAGQRTCPASRSRAAVSRRWLARISPISTGSPSPSDIAWRNSVAVSARPQRRSKAAR
jgi:hypothetical protein